MPFIAPNAPASVTSNNYTTKKCTAKIHFLTPKIMQVQKSPTGQFLSEDKKKTPPHTKITPPRTHHPKLNQLKPNHPKLCKSKSLQ